MIEFNALEITGTLLTVDVQISSVSFFDNVYIDHICFDTEDTFVDTGPSSKARTIYSAEADEFTKNVNVSVDIETLQDKLIFVYVIVKGNVSPDTPCSIKKSMEVGVAYRKLPIYNMAIKGLRIIECCDVPRDFIDFILKYKAFELAIEVGAFSAAIEYWKQFFGEKKRVLKPKCGCHG